ncbi:MAG: ATP-binding protein [Methanosarcinales archaeon]
MVYKDLVDRYKIEKISAIKFIIKFLVRNFGRALSIRKVHSFLSSTRHTLSKNKTYEYFSYLEDVNFIFLIRKIGTGIREIESSTPKVYINDVGFATVYGVEDIGNRIENIVAMDLLREKHSGNPLLELYYWKDYRQREVDFVLKEGLEVKQLVQVTYASSKDEIEKRELEALVKASRELKCKDLLVITWDYEDETKIEKTTIKFIPLWKWLLV